MKPFHHILFPVDFSPRSMAMAPTVASVAGAFGAKLSLIHALDLPPAGFSEWYAYVSTINVEEMTASVKSSLKRFKGEYMPGVEADLFVDAGSPADAIASYVKKHDIDLVMMPTHGHGKFRSLLLGSVTAAVLHDVHCPVWTDAHAEKTHRPAPTNGTHKTDGKRMIVCAVDLTPASIHVLEAAKSIAANWNATFHVIHAETAVEEAVHSESGARFRRFLIYRAKEDFAPLATLAGVSTDLEIVEGPVGSSLAKAVEAHHAELLIIGRGTIQGTLGRLRSHAYDLIRRAPCPVLSV